MGADYSESTSSRFILPNLHIVDVRYDNKISFSFLDLTEQQYFKK